MDGTNYNQWKTNLYIVLDYEKIKFVLTTPRPNELVADASQQIQTRYSEWQKANIAVRCYILVSVAGHLQEQISKLESGAEMIQTLDGMFAKSSSASRQAAIRALMNTRMTGGSVRDHCLAMMSYINRAEVMGATLEEKIKIDIIFESLPDSFNHSK